MIVEICVGLITAAFIVLVIFLIIALRNLILTLRQSRHTLQNINHLTLDLKAKSEALNLFFNPLAKLSKKKTDLKHLKNFEKAAEMINFATDGILLFNKLRKRK